VPQIHDTPDTRQLILGGQVQGASYFNPTAAAVVPDLIGPGPIPACRYMAGWLAAGVLDPFASAVMVGLGSGAGAIAYLHETHADLTVVEIDPEIVKLAESGFPLLVHYQDLGRLNIIIGKAEDVLGEEVFDVGMCDAYTGNNALVDAVLAPTLRSCKTFWCNYISTYADKAQRDLLNEMDLAGTPATALLAASGLSHGIAMSMLSNWIVTNAELDWEKLDNYKPFESYDTDSAEWIQQAYKDVISCNYLS